MASSKKTAQLNKELRSMRSGTGKSAGNRMVQETSSRKSRPEKKQPVKKAVDKQEHVSVSERKTWGPALAIMVGVLTGLLLELCMFRILGTAGGWVQYGLSGMFGAMAYVFPILAALIIIFTGVNVPRKRLIFFSILLFILLCAFSHLTSSFSLNNRNILSYFSSCAESRSGGGILGGALALGLYLMLSKTGAIIILILLMLLCIFFLFEGPIKYLFSYIFSRDEEDEYEYEDEDEYVMKEPAAVPGKKDRSRKRPGEYVPEDTINYDERYIRRVQDYRRGRTQKPSRVIYDDPVVITENEDETIIRIVKNKKPKKPVHDVPLTRSNRKASPLRDPDAAPQRTSAKARGVSTELDMMPHNANGDEIHEITRRKGKKQGEGVFVSRRFFDETLIRPSDEEQNYQQLEWNVLPEAPEPDTKEAAVTSVSQAAVNRRAKEARPVKTRKQEPVPAKQAQEKVESVPAGISDRPLPYNAPPMELLARVKQRNRSSEAELEKIAENLELILEQFGVNATVTDIQAGPSVTRFELQPELGTRVNRITSLADDLKLNLGVTEIRIEAPIPGRQAVGIEIPNKNRQTVFMRELLEEPTLVNHPSRIAFAAGKDISGNVVVADIAKMPHLLVAGTTGSGKSVFLNTILMTILYRSSPAEVGLIIVDPKKVEFGVYAGIPHLMKEVVTDPSQAVSTLRWAVSEMTSRYQRMQLSSVRDFKSYNAKVEKGTVNPEEENPRKMNQIVIIIDELADLMMVAKKEAEALICRLAQLARAAGIHLIIATQRPSVDVVTGLIKANVPARVALLVSSQIDSRTIIDMPGAEKLLGNGDMLFYPTGYVKPVRVQGAFVSDDEIQQTVDYLIRNNKQDYFAAESKEIEKFMNAQGGDDPASSGEKESDSGSQYDEFFYEAGKLCIEMGKASSSMLQRRFNLGFNRAARIIDQLEDFGAVGPQQGAKPREILVDLVTFEEMYRSMKEA